MMKKLLAVFLILALLLPVSAFALEPLSETEQRYVGGWAMYTNCNTSEHPRHGLPHRSVRGKEKEPPDRPGAFGMSAYCLRRTPCR